jgi:hypothetical protein
MHLFVFPLLFSLIDATPAPVPALEAPASLGLDLDRTAQRQADNTLKAGIALTVLGAAQVVPIAVGASLIASGAAPTRTRCPDCGVGVLAGELMIGFAAGAAVALLTPGIVFIVRGKERLRLLAPAVVLTPSGALATAGLSF